MKFPAQGSQEWLKLLGAVKIGYTSEAQVILTDTSAWMAHVCRLPDQRVDQVTCTIMPLGANFPGPLNAKRCSAMRLPSCLHDTCTEHRCSPNAELKARFLLEAAYEGVYLAAGANKRTRVFITPLAEEHVSPPARSAPTARRRRRGRAQGVPVDWCFDAFVNVHKARAAPRWSSRLPALAMPRDVPGSRALTRAAQRRSRSLAPGTTVIVVMPGVRRNQPDLVARLVSSLVAPPRPCRPLP